VYQQGMMATKSLGRREYNITNSVTFRAGRFRNCTIV